MSSVPPDAVALIADDHDLFQVTLASLSKRLGFSRVIQVGSLAAALTELKANKTVSVATFDLEMPGMNGADSIALVKEVSFQTKIVVISSSAEKNNILAALRIGTQGYLLKSSGIGEIGNALRHVLAGAIPVPAQVAAFLFEALQTSDRLPLSASSPAPLTEDVSFLLTSTQRDVLALLLAEQSDAEIGRLLGITPVPLATHCAALMRILGLTN